MPVYANDPSMGGGGDSEDGEWIEDDDNQTVDRPRSCSSPIDGMPIFPC
jgi:hypothetical protein